MFYAIARHCVNLFGLILNNGGLTNLKGIAKNLHHLGNFLRFGLCQQVDNG